MEEEGGIIGREDIEEYVDDLFSENDTNKLERAIDFLVDAVKDPNKTAQTHRAYVCYALNAKRSEQTEIKGKKQFDGLCRVISSLLSGCSTSGGDIANSKMCMMLSQTFFIVENGNNGDAESLNNIKTPDRKNRLFVKSKLVGHSLWNDDDFWCVVLSTSALQTCKFSLYLTPCYCGILFCRFAGIMPFINAYRKLLHRAR